MKNGANEAGLSHGDKQVCIRAALRNNPNRPRVPRNSRSDKDGEKLPGTTRSDARNRAGQRVISLFAQGPLRQCEFESIHCRPVGSALQQKHPRRLINYAQALCANRCLRRSQRRCPFASEAQDQPGKLAVKVGCHLPEIVASSRDLGNWQERVS